MKIKSIISSLMSVGVAFALTACGSTPKAPPIAVSISTAPAATLEISYTTTIAASVTGDALNGGVDWTVTCGSADCGSFSPTAHSGSGTSLSYTAPASIPTGATVTITAASTTDSTATATATVTIVGVATAASFAGQYAFELSGLSFDNGPYTTAGSFTVDGAGNVTAIEQDYCAYFFGCSTHDVLTGAPTIGASAYTVGSDGLGRGTLVLDLSSVDTSVGVLGVESFSFALTATTGTSNTHGLISAMDSGDSASGTIDAQDPTAFALTSLSGGYSFTANGWDTTVGNPLGWGSVLTLDGNGNTLAQILDYNDGGNVDGGGPITGAITGSVSAAPDANGYTTIEMAGGYFFAIYVVNGEVLRTMEIDGDLITAGAIYGQGNNAFSNGSLSGNFVLNDNGYDVFFGGPMTGAGQIATDGAGNITGGVLDLNDDYSVTTAGLLAGSTYSMPNTGGGRGAIVLPGTITTTQDVSYLFVYMTDPALNLLDPNNASGGGGALILDGDFDTEGTGVVVPQVASSVIQANFGVDVQTIDFFGSETDAVGQGLSDGSANIAGLADFNNDFLFESGDAIALTFAADASNPGRLTGTYTIDLLPVNITYYQASSGQLLFVETDALNSADGVLIQQ